ncbi:hypothetical protein H5119_17430 [Pseudoalteromonas sp. SG45-5]|nr:hypothetical protein [Pseudoalteromonas sp. SG45-5]MBB1395408.1 hypothetical protein [Pseudoalteromonas sp. SG44-4]MBB1447949.1 hypothetical protein [Pseudoalteromonas sp. SG41-6]
MLTDERREILYKAMLSSGRIYDKPADRITIEGILYRMRTGLPKLVDHYTGMDWYLFGRANVVFNETDKNAQEQLVLLVKLVLDDIGELNKLPPVTQRSLLRIIRLMAERQNKTAIAILSKYFE